MEMNIIDTTEAKNAELSELSQKILKEGLALVHASIKAGDVPEWGPAENVVFIIGDEGTDVVAGYVHKDDLEKSVREMGLTEERVTSRIITKCRGATPAGAIRVLLVTPDIAVACLTGAPSDLVKIPGLKEAEREEIKQKVLQVLEPYPRDVQRKALLEALDWKDDLAALIRGYKDVAEGTVADPHEPETDVVVEVLSKIFLPFVENLEDMERRARKVEIPPDRHSPSHVEAMAMALAYALEPIAAHLEDVAATEYALAPLTEYASVRGAPTLHKLLRRAAMPREDVYPNILSISSLMKFASEWMRCGFARLEIGHKLAASLALTDVPDDIEVLHPWTAWSLVIPDGLLGNHTGPNGEPAPVSRIWCMGTEPVYFVSGDGGLTGPCTPDSFKKGLGATSEHLVECIYSIIKGACLALDDPEGYKKESLKSKTSSSKPKQSRDGLPDFGQSRFMLSAPVQVDVREHLLNLLSGKKGKGGGSAPTVQFFVRGHWRNQAHGPGRSLRKRLRIEGFWKGPEESRIALRNYKVKDDQ